MTLFSQKRAIVCAVVCALSTSTLDNAFAHDFVLWPTPARLKAPERLSLRLWVGDHMAFEEQRSYTKDRVTRFEHRSAQGTVDLAQGRQNALTPPFATVDIRKKGGHWISLDRPAMHIELEAPRFNGYLEHERLEAVSAERTRRKEAKLPGKERYTRHLKTFVQVGRASDGQGCKATGQEFEIVPLQDPALLKKGATLKVELRVKGEPLANHPFEAMTRVDKKVVRVPLKTDAKGQAEVKFGHAGQWLLRSVEMRRCVGCEKAQWTSRWTAFSLDVLPGKMKESAPACPEAVGR